MNETPLLQLASRYGIEARFRDTLGRSHVASDATIMALLTAIGLHVQTKGDVTDALNAPKRAPWQAPQIARNGTLDVVTNQSGDWRIELEDGTNLEGRMTNRLVVHDLPIGIHRLHLDEPVHLIVPPGRAPDAQELTGRARHWGLAAPIYGLTGGEGFGLGTYRDLARLAESGAPLGASYVAINPVHALFHKAPEWFSPYSPSHRRFLNIQHIDPSQVPEFASSDAARELIGSHGAEIAALRNAPLIDYRRTARVRDPVLRALFATWAALPEHHPRRQAFATWRAERGAAIEHFALFEALTEDHGACWTDWPAPLGTPQAAKRAGVAPDRVTFHAYLQWIAEAQLSEAQARAKGAGMSFGLMLDLAVGVCPQGAEVWAEPDVFAQGVAIGAPPDDFNPKGQNWALSPLNPLAMQAGGLNSFIETMRAAMRHAGALRIDHILGLKRNFWIAEETGEGAYIRFPQDGLFAITALEAERNRCLVVGEDLGNVPTGFRDEMEEAGFYGYRLFYFQRQKTGAFDQPSGYSPVTMASIGCHDLPTLREWWAGTDLAEMAEIGVLEPEAFDQARDQRAAERAHLLTLLDRDPDQSVTDLQQLFEDVHVLLADGASDLMTVQLEMLGSDGARLNLPGTTTAYPNWRRRVPALAQISADPAIMRLADRVGRTRR